MFTGWLDLVRKKVVKRNNEFVSVDVGRLKDPGSYEMLGRNADKTPEPTFSPVTPLSPSAHVPPKSGRETPDYFGREARYKSPSRSFSSPKAPPHGQQQQGWGPERPTPVASPYLDPLGMNKI